MASIERALVRRQFKSSQEQGLASYNAAKKQIVGGNALTTPVPYSEG